jgi:hypothetical protein
MHATVNLLRGPAMLNVMRTLEEQGTSYRAITRELSRLNIRTGRGSQWHDVTVEAALTGSRSAAA